MTPLDNSTPTPHTAESIRPHAAHPHIPQKLTYLISLLNYTSRRYNAASTAYRPPATFINPHSLTQTYKQKALTLYIITHVGHRPCIPQTVAHSNRHTSPNTPRFSTRHIQTHQHHLPTHNHTPTTWPSPLTIETSPQIYYTNHTKNPEKSTMRTHNNSHPQATCTKAHTHPHIPHILTAR